MGEIRAGHGSDSRDAQLGDAVVDTLRGALRIVGGMVQMAAGITRLFAIAALKGAAAVEEAVVATADEGDKPEMKPKP